jgi:hypothetical protein
MFYLLRGDEDTCCLQIASGAGVCHRVYAYGRRRACVCNKGDIRINMSTALVPLQCKCRR